MPNLMPSDIVGEVERVLLSAAPGDFSPPRPNFLTAYQILDRLPIAIRSRLITERTLGGQGTGKSYSASSLVSDAAEKIPGIIIEYIDNRGITLSVTGATIKPGFEVCGIYRLGPRT